MSSIGNFSASGVCSANFFIQASRARPQPIECPHVHSPNHNRIRRRRHRPHHLPSGRKPAYRQQGAPAHPAQSRAARRDRLGGLAALVPAHRGTAVWPDRAPDILTSGARISATRDVAPLSVNWICDCAIPDGCTKRQRLFLDRRANWRGSGRQAGSGRRLPRFAESRIEVALWHRCVTGHDRRL